MNAITKHFRNYNLGFTCTSAPKTSRSVTIARAALGVLLIAGTGLFATEAVRRFEKVADEDHATRVAAFASPGAAYAYAVEIGEASEAHEQELAQSQAREASAR